MRALRKVTAGPGLQLLDIEQPTPGFGEVKIRVMRSGLCGTDVHLFNWDGGAPGSLTPPQTLGHEFFGEIVEIGPGVVTGFERDELHVGQKVSVEGHIVCGRCRNCRAGRKHMCIRAIGIGVNRDGGFADYVVVPAGNVWVQPDSIDAELGALFDPLGNAVHSCQQLEITGQDVLITGAGPIGIMCVAIAKHAGARNVVITDMQADRLALAKGAGADATVDIGRDSLTEVMHRLGIREGFDAGLEMSGAPGGLDTLISTCTHGATIAMLGLPKGPFPINWNAVITRMLTIKGVYGREMFDTWYLATYMMETSKELRDAVRSIITHRFTPEQWNEAFAAAASGTAGKVIIDWES
ncbi:L-threonine 3-dehydrogenase [Schaalia sp. ZJ405]|uniref:L-threonine 3-dehydrogenase n=1 Tax=unclassified Schaalia TaxID=2691889 RepID=UPI0013EB2602|nr:MULTISPECIES: L-threonine 3-dehydrogenase [unclassified Schaalia]QPK81492.1 L-threonine 3-dehydrogenase [Schaalia sp. ZJ405]